jgi:hypothetical protein
MRCRSLLPPSAIDLAGRFFVAFAIALFPVFLAQHLGFSDHDVFDPPFAAFACALLFVEDGF